MTDYQFILTEAQAGAGLVRLAKDAVNNAFESYLSDGLAGQ